ncbi:MAG TPA: hypothetical protein VFX98_02760, partial [Longimicrobiaceae bacterium]|nr:hypothetical protein [Longimicrobiaceae bacterium]
MSRSVTLAIHQEPRMRIRSPGTWVRMGMLACAALVLTRCAPPQQPPADSAAVRAGRVELGSPEGGDCSSLRFDLRRGTLNGLSPEASMEQVKA